MMSIPEAQLSSEVYNCKRLATRSVKDGNLLKVADISTTAYEAKEIISCLLFCVAIFVFHFLQGYFSYDYALDIQSERKAVGGWSSLIHSGFSAKVHAKAEPPRTSGARLALM